MNSFCTANTATKFQIVSYLVTYYILCYCSYIFCYCIYIFCYCILEIGSNFNAAMTHFKVILIVKKVFKTCYPFGLRPFHKKHSVCYKWTNHSLEITFSSEYDWVIYFVPISNVRIYLNTIIHLCSHFLIISFCCYIVMGILLVSVSRAM